MIKRLVSLLLCSAICVVAAAAADNWQYSKWTATVTGVSNIKYHGRTAITASKGLVRSTATILSTNTSSSTGVTASTGQASGAGTYTAQGTTYYATSSNRDMETLELESVDYKTLVRANGGKNLTSEQKEIHTNSAGETYGEAMVVKYLKADVDLISAVGKNGVEGYIKTSDLPHNIPDYVPYDHEIPVYENDGVTVIDSFFISSGYAN